MPAAAQSLIWRNPCLRPLRPKVGLRHKTSASLVWDPGWLVSLAMGAEQE